MTIQCGHLGDKAHSAAEYADVPSPAIGGSGSEMTDADKQALALIGPIRRSEAIQPIISGVASAAGG